MKELKRKKGEPFDAFMRRVRTDWKRCGILREKKKRTYFTPKVSKNVVRTLKVKKMKNESKRAYLIRVGKMAPPEERFNQKKS